MLSVRIKRVTRYSRGLLDELFKFAWPRDGKNFNHMEQWCFVLHFGDYPGMNLNQPKSNTMYQFIVTWNRWWRGSGVGFLRVCVWWKRDALVETKSVTNPPRVATDVPRLDAACDVEHARMIVEKESEKFVGGSVTENMPGATWEDETIRLDDKGPGTRGGGETTEAKLGR
jgi:hypothetical protein